MTRDELCKNGEFFVSPALSVSLRLREIFAEIEEMLKENAPKETQEDAKRGESEICAEQAGSEFSSTDSKKYISSQVWGNDLM